MTERGSGDLTPQKALFGAHAWSMKSKKEEQPVALQVRLASGAAFPETEAAAWAELEARTLANLPANVLTPAAFCERVRAAAAGLPVELRVFEEAELEALGLRGLLVVGKGSQEKIKMLEIVYRGRRGGVDVGLVGKGERVAFLNSSFFSSCR